MCSHVGYCRSCSLIRNTVTQQFINYNIFSSIGYLVTGTNFYLPLLSISNCHKDNTLLTFVVVVHTSCMVGFLHNDVLSINSTATIGKVPEFFKLLGNFKPMLRSGGNRQINLFQDFKDGVTGFWNYLADG